MSWDYFKIGQRLGGVKILDIIKPTQAKKTTTYQIVFDCCAAEKSMSHRRIGVRAEEGTQHCKRCRPRNAPPPAKVGRRSPKVPPRVRKIEAAECPYIRGYHGWPVPPSAMRMPLGWLPR